MHLTLSDVLKRGWAEVLLQLPALPRLLAQKPVVQVPSPQLTRHSPQLQPLASTAKRLSRYFHRHPAEGTPVRLAVLALLAPLWQLRLALLPALWLLQRSAQQ
jgi:hypothetical protein